MDGFSLIPASELAPEQLVPAFNRAFTGYLVPMTQTTESLAKMIETNDIQLRDSLVLHAPNGDNSDGLQAIGVALLAVRKDRGWVGGMAIAPEWRGRGVGDYLMRALAARARALGLRTLQLEVLEANTAAYRLYERLGFRVVRPLFVYTGPLDATKLAHIEQMPGAIGPIAVAEALHSFAEMHPVAPPWQREPISLLKTGERLTGLALRRNNAVQAYLLTMPSGAGQAVMDLASRASVAAERTAQGIALLRHLLAATPDASIRAINVPTGDLLGDALDALRCPIVNRQREMSLNLY